MFTPIRISVNTLITSYRMENIVTYTILSTVPQVSHQPGCAGGWQRVLRGQARRSETGRAPRQCAARDLPLAVTNQRVQLQSLVTGGAAGGFNGFYTTQKNTATCKDNQVPMRLNSFGQVNMRRGLGIKI